MANTVRKLELVVGATPPQCRVHVDGEDFACNKFVLEASYDDITRVTLSHLAHNDGPTHIVGRLAVSAGQSAIRDFYTGQEMHDRCYLRFSGWEAKERPEWRVELDLELVIPPIPAKGYISATVRGRKLQNVVNVRVEADIAEPLTRIEIQYIRLDGRLRTLKGFLLPPKSESEERG